jgi:hypothetical protein
MYTQKFVPATPRKALAVAAFAVTTVLATSTVGLFSADSGPSNQVVLTQTTYSEGRVTVTALRPVVTAGVPAPRNRS